jgi:hypothetical protein
MHPRSFLTGSTVLLVPLLAAGVADAQQAKPADSPPQVHKQTIYNGAVPRVSYYVQGGSPHQDASYRALQFTENELTIAEEDQNLRMADLAGAATWSPQRYGLRSNVGYAGYGYGGYYSPVDNALQLIRLREDIQTELAGAPKPLAPLRNRQAPPDALHRAIPQIPSFSAVTTRLAGGPPAPFMHTGREIRLIRR